MSDPRYRIVHGDSRDVLARMREACVDAVVTDPPYELAFMGKSWDASGISFDPEFWRLVYRVLKPGGYLLTFGGTRTWHRIAVAIENAGFKFRDTLMWLYGSGFPKSLDVSKAIDKSLGAKRTVLIGKKRSGLDAPTISVGAFSALPENAPDPETGLLPIYAPATDDAALWDGWGTGLKPAWEPIMMFRKPLAGTVAQNVLKHGTGGINVDGTRLSGAVPGSGVHSRGPDAVMETGLSGEFVYDGSKGRWPANVLLDEESAAMLDEQSGDFGGASRFFYVAKASRLERELGLLKDVQPSTPPAVEHHGEGSKGLQSPHAGTGRLAGSIRNTHATVKPLQLMRYLIRLVTPPGGIVLDPFLGSGTTAVAAKVEGFSALGIEQDKRYVLITRSALKVPLVRRMQKLAEAARREAREARDIKSTPLFEE